MPALDERLLKVTITIRGKETVFEKLDIHAIGTKHTSDLQNALEVRIANVSRDLRHALLTEGTPFTQIDNPEASILIEAGRKSIGLTQIYVGDITTVQVTQPPDIELVIRALTGQHIKGNIIALNQGPLVAFRTLVKDAAEVIGVPDVFKAQDKQVANFQFSGASERLVSKLAAIDQNVNVFIDDGVLVAQTKFDSENKPVTQVNLNTGLIGIPEFIDFGARCTVLIESETQNLKLGDDIELVSEQYPDTTGRYSVYRLAFDLANRDTPFYYAIDAARQDIGRLFSNRSAAELAENR